MFKQSAQHGWRFWIKTLFDRSAALFGLIVMSPLLMFLGVLVWLSMGRPVLFRQKRPGRFAKPFEVLKFRTMSNQRDAAGNLLPDADRLTQVGWFIRSLSLDEIPQLWNVLRGEVSLVGPRPLLMEYLDYYTPVQARRHDVVPGITGWAQVHGRNTISWDEKFAYDIWYVDHWNLALDFKILIITVKKVILREGIINQRRMEMPAFKGK